MNPKVIKNFSLPWTPQGENVTGNHQILVPREKPTVYELYSALFPPCKLTRSHFLAFLCQFFDLVGRAIVTGT